MVGIWGDFENYIQKSRKGADTKACILSGPVLTTDDPKVDFGDGPLQYPEKFWKVVCISDPEQAGGVSKLKVFGFILSQKDVVDEFGLGVESFKPGRFKDYRAKLTAITEATGVVFDQALIDAEAN